METKAMKDLLKNIVNEQSAEYIIKTFPTAKHIINATDQEINAIPNLTRKKVHDLKNVINLCREILKPDQSMKIIQAPNDVFEYLAMAQFYPEERFMAILLTTKYRIIDTVLISKGTLTGSMVHPREFFSPAIRVNAAGIIAVHNHPSGDPEPSYADKEITMKLKQASKILGINLLDHIIVGNGSYVSLKELGIYDGGEKQ